MNCEIQSIKLIFILDMTFLLTLFVHIVTRGNTRKVMRKYGRQSRQDKNNYEQGFTNMMHAKSINLFQ